ncbi:hypothetical protein [Acuticoccus sp. I52.16.1]|uniref:hypothetical protein n=1 Tax=Acuticoccus sp. I52.16.1 TaxID=2928472 RepID=UPI001FD34EDF|nr:hypothetical protein [Acuticoccus sp. I52.16.1]UOM35796.1 hypothetical protein MRB58_06220 [Acuticoccus sp. I52.16.1]
MAAGNARDVQNSPGLDAPKEGATRVRLAHYGETGRPPAAHQLDAGPSAAVLARFRVTAGRLAGAAPSPRPDTARTARWLAGEAR